jgi:3',5'-cyclic AMP phosphodiesterase CpdA
VSVLIQISDPHFGTERAQVAAALLEFAHAQKPALAILSGDITQRARRHEFRAAVDFVRALEVPRCLVVPGNHDIPLFNLAARVFWPYAAYQRAFGADLEPEHESQTLLVLCVNTTRPRQLTDGEVSEAQVQRVAARLRRASREQLRVVVTHQPVHVIRGVDQHNVLIGHERAVRAWAAAGADVILGGHIHLPYVRSLSDAFPDLPRRIWVAQAGTAVSRRVRRGVPNSINVLRHGETAAALCRVERWDYDADQGAFVRVEALDLPLDRGD